MIDPFKRSNYKSTWAFILVGGLFLLISLLYLVFSAIVAAVVVVRNLLFKKYRNRYKNGGWI